MIEMIVSAVTGVTSAVFRPTVHAAQRGEDYQRSLRHVDPKLAELDAEIIRVRDEMWATPILTPKRVRLEHRVNHLISLRDQRAALAAGKTSPDGKTSGTPGRGGHARGAKDAGFPWLPAILGVTLLALVVAFFRRRPAPRLLTGA